MDRSNLQKDVFWFIIIVSWSKSKKNKIPEIKGKSFNLKHTRIVIRKWYLHSKLIRKIWIIQIYKRTTFLLDHYSMIEINRKKNETKHHSLKNKSEVYSNYSKAISSKLIKKTWIIEIYKKIRLLIDPYPIIEINQKKNETR